MSNSNFTFDEFDTDSLLLERSSLERDSLEREFFLDSLISKFLLTLTSSKDEQTFEFLKDLILKINEHADSREYVIVFARIKKDKKKETRKA
jgi:ferritin